MNKATKIWLIIAAALILIGAILFGCAAIMAKGDFEKIYLESKGKGDKV